LTESKGIPLAGNPVTGNTLCAIARAAVLTVRQRASAPEPLWVINEFLEIQEEWP
jgi:hypothetical protein